MKKPPSGPKVVKPKPKQVEEPEEEPDEAEKVYIDVFQFSFSC